LRVLVADDDRDAVVMLAMLLNDEGHEVHTVYDGGAVIPELAGFQPDVALLDIGMPGYSGYEVARYVRRRYGDESGIVLVAVTGWKKPSDRILAKLAGFDHHLAKPVDPSELLALVRACRPRPEAPPPG
jgi:DNA-binding response OmpR family regulator